MVALVILVVAFWVRYFWNETGGLVIVTDSIAHPRTPIPPTLCYAGLLVTMHTWNNFIKILEIQSAASWKIIATMQLYLYICMYMSCGYFRILLSVMFISQNNSLVVFKTWSRKILILTQCRWQSVLCNVATCSNTAL